MTLDAKTGFGEALRPFLGQKTRVGVYLRGGQFLNGKVVDLGDHAAVLGELQGKDFYDALVRLEDISAIEIKAR
jgi:hypothetical protein